jgi:hypothetical protein
MPQRHRDAEGAEKNCSGAMRLGLVGRIRFGGSPLKQAATMTDCDTPNEGSYVAHSNCKADATHLGLNFVEVLHVEQRDSTERQRRDRPDGNRESQ